MYELRRPAPALDPFVENYWFVTNAGDPVDLRVDVYVDARADLILNHGVSYWREVIGDTSTEVVHSNLDAQRLTPIRISQRGLVDIAGVRFRLGGLGPFARRPLAPWTNQTPAPEAILGQTVTALERELAATHNLDNKAALLDAFLFDRLEIGRAQAAFAESLAELVASDGTGPLYTGSTPAQRRNRARLFERYLGLPPRTVARILRFQRALRALMSQPSESLAEVAANAGYYDQAHFIREFRVMTGGVPRGYRGYFPPDGPADFAPNVVAYVQDDAPRHD